MANTHKHYEAAKRAHYWMSHNPDRRAESECTYFDAIMAEFADAPQVQQKFERLFLLSLAAKSRCASAGITGPANFPVEKQRRASERERKVTDEMLAYVERVRKAIKQEAYYTAHPEARPVMSGDEDALDRLKHKLAFAQQNHEKMIAANKLIRSKDMAALQKLFPEKPLEEVLKP